MTYPNIVLLTVDCLRADHVSCYGYRTKTTPNIDQLASDGFRWERCYSTGPRTNESFPGIIASALSTDCGFVSERWHRSPPTPTLASWLSEKGYDTVARVANPQLAKMKGYDYGFNSFHNLAVGTVGWGVSESTTSSDDSQSGNYISQIASRIGSQIHDIRSNIRQANWLTRWAMYAPAFYAYREYQRRSGWPTVDGADVARKLIDTFANKSLNSPSFHWAHFNDIHAPIHPERAHSTEICQLSTRKQYNSDIRRISQQQTEGYIEMYDAMVRYVDEQIGKIVKELKESGAWENSIVIVTADHGEALYDRGIHGHASGKDRYLYDDSRDYMYNELLQVPLILGGGAITDSRTISEPTSTAWLHEIIAEVAGITPGEFVRSSNRESHFDSDEQSVILADALTDRGHTFAAISGEDKIITQSLQPDDSLTENALYFDLSVDPLEHEPKNIDGVPKNIINEIQGNIIQLSDLNNRAPREQITDGTKELLSQLGYAE